MQNNVIIIYFELYSIEMPMNNRLGKYLKSTKVKNIFAQLLYSSFIGSGTNLPPSMFWRLPYTPYARLLSSFWGLLS